MMLIDSDNHAASCNTKGYTPLTCPMGGQQTMLGQQQLDSIVKSFPTPEMSPLDSPDKPAMFGQQQHVASGQQQQHYSMLADELEPNQSMVGNPFGSQQHQQAYSHQPFHQDKLPAQYRGDNRSNESGAEQASAVSQLIARFGDQSNVLKNVQPPYKYRMIVSTSVASSLTDQSIQKQLRESCNETTNLDNNNKNKTQDTGDYFEQQQQVSATGDQTLMNGTCQQEAAASESPQQNSKESSPEHIAPEQSFRADGETGCLDGESGSDSHKQIYTTKSNNSPS